MISRMILIPSVALIEDFRRFRRFHYFCASFWTLPGSKSHTNTFILWIWYGSEQFSNENPWNFGACCKALPERGQKRSGRENHGFSESVTWTCSKRDFSSIFVGYSSMIFDDFHGFSHISSFSRIVLHASRMQIASKHVHFMDSVWIRAIFGWKSMKFRRLVQNITWTWSEALRTWKSH